jgi:hypothetical protein
MSLFTRLRAGLLLGATVTLVACGDDDDNNGPTPPPTPTNPPAGVTVAGVSSTSVRVSWTAATGATRYIVQRAPATGDFAQLSDTVTGTQYLDAGLQPGTPYRYRVAAVRAAGTSDFSTVVDGSTLAPGRGSATISANITSSRTLFADTTYTLSGFIQVLSGATLTIEPGTKIIGDFDVPGSSLFITRGARIVANGTAQNPIVFTSERSVGQRQPGDWGGLIIVGNAPINRTGQVIIEGTGTGSSNPPQVYSGGNNPTDNSGSLRYVRVEFAGFATATDAELNSFTFAAVGSGTQMEYLEALAGLDDHFEWFGGTADAKYLVSYESGDDHFDMSEGFSGRLQYLVGYQSTVLAPRPAAGSPSSDPQGIENDGCAGAGCTDGQNSAPLTVPVVANFTLIGTGPGVVPAGGGFGMMIRRGTGGYYVNGIVANWPNAAIAIRDAATNTRITEGNLLISNILQMNNNAVFQTPNGTSVFGLDTTANNIRSAAGTTASVFLGLTQPNFDWTPSATSPAREGGLATFPTALAQRAGTFVTGTTYRGAANPTGPKWWQGWTTYARN